LSQFHIATTSLFQPISGAYPMAKRMPVVLMPATGLTKRTRASEIIEKLREAVDKRAKIPLFGGGTHAVAQLTKL